jgi:hypothetical protein
LEQVAIAMVEAYLFAMGDESLMLIAMVGES